MTTRNTRMTTHVDSYDTQHTHDHTQHTYDDTHVDSYDTQHTHDHT